MTIRGYRNNIGWDIAKRVRAYRSSVSNWVNAKTISVYRSSGVSPYWDMVYPDAPQNSSSVSVVGSGEVNTSFTLSDNTPWVTDPYVEVDSTTYQWQSSNSQSGPWANVSGATSTSYNILSTDLGKYFRCILTATNERGSTQLTSLTSVQVSDPTYTFNFGQSFGVYPNAFIRLDESSSGFPPTDSILAVERTLAYFFGEFKQFDLLYKSDLNTLRIYHRLYREDRTSRPANPDAEYEIVFTSGSNTVDIYVVNSFNTQYITSYAAYLKGFSVYKQYSSLLYFDGIKFSVPMNSSSGISSAIGHASNAIQISSVSISGGVATFTTVSPHNILGSAYIYGLTGDLSEFNGRKSPNVTGNNTFTLSTSLSNRTVFPSDARSAYIPSFLTGWIYINTNLDSDDTPVSFYSGSGLPSPLFGSNSSYNKQNMFWPSSATIAAPTNIGVSSATFSWSGSNANSYVVSAARADNSTVVFSDTTTTSTSMNITGFQYGVTYNISVRPNSRFDSPSPLGQFGFTATRSYTHVGAPSAPTNVTGTAGNAQVALTWTAPSSNGSAITGYKVRYSSNGGVSWSSTISTGSTSNTYTVTGLTNGTSYIFQVLATNSVGDGPWSSSSASITPEIVATKVVATASSSTILTSITGDLRTSTITAQLQDSSNPANNVAKSGVTITFTLSGTAGGSLSATTATTDSTGKASVTYTSGTTGNATGGTTIVATITPSATGLTGTATSVTVNLRSAFPFTLSASGTTKGVLFTKSANDSNYTWSAATGSPSVGYLESGDSYANNSFDIIVPVLRNSPPGRPQVSVDSGAKSANCDMSVNGVTVYDLNRSTSVTLTAKRSGFNDGSATGTATSALTFTRTFLWQFATASDNFTTWRTDWPSAFVVNGVQTWNTQTLKWTGTPNSRKIRCRVTTDVTGVFADPSNTSVPSQDVRFTSNEPTIP
jgi:hypothetical protein